MDTLPDKGARVRLNESAGRLWRVGRNRNRIGTVIGASRDKTCARLRWDGDSVKSDHTIHKHFLELDDV